MKRKYVKLYLENCSFWQTNHDKRIVEEKNYELKDESILNYIYFKQITPNILEEELTNEKIILDSNTKNIILPKGIKIDPNNFSECSIEEIINTFNEMKLKNLNKEYYQTLCDFIYRSNICGRAEERKNNISLNLSNK